MTGKSSLSAADPILFSPIRLDTEVASIEKLLACYRFADLFFPKVGGRLVQTMLNMERHGERLIANCSPQEVGELIRKMENLSVDLDFSVSDGGRTMLEMAIHIVPSDVLERVRQGRDDVVSCRHLGDDLDKLMARLIVKEMQRRVAAMITDGCRALAGIKQVPSFLAQLLDLRWSNRQGQVLQEASIDDLLIGRYRAQFEQVMPWELVQEGMRIRETVATCLAIDRCNDESLIHGARARHALLEITMRETRGH